MDKDYKESIFSHGLVIIINIYHVHGHLLKEITTRTHQVRLYERSLVNYECGWLVKSKSKELLGL